MTTASAQSLSLHTQLKEWGTSRGIRIPKPFCDTVGISIGSDLNMQTGVDEKGSYIIVRPIDGEHRSFADAPYISMTEIFDGWQGEHGVSSDRSGIGNEIDWGADVGAEVIQ